MRVTSERKLEASNRETMKIEITWDPTNVNEDNLIAYLGVTIDLVNKLHKLDYLSDDE